MLVVNPLSYMYVTGRYRTVKRPNHNGTDYRAPVGTPVYAVHDGVVVHRTNPTAGTNIEIAGNKGVRTGYSHLSKRTVANGATVKAGEKIGESGNTGRSQAPHLHFYVYLNGKFTDPDKWLKKNVHVGPFLDVKSTDKFASEIEWMSKAGITNGWKDGTFRPKSPVTREAMAAFLYRLAGRPAVKLPKKSPFKDVKVGSQFFREIVWLSQSGITTGYADGTFKPKDHIARDAMAAFLYRASGESFKTPAKPHFKDVPKSAQFYREIEWLRSKGITTGYKGRKYKPYDEISREATAAFLYRYNK